MGEGAAYLKAGAFLTVLFELDANTVYFQSKSVHCIFLNCQFSILILG